MMCRCCYLLSNEKAHKIKKANEGRTCVCVCVLLGMCRGNSWQAADKQMKYKQKQYSSIKNKDEMLSSLAVPRSVRALVCSRPNPQNLVTLPPFLHITETQVCIQLTYLCHKNTRIRGGG